MNSPRRADIRPILHVVEGQQQISIGTPQQRRHPEAPNRLALNSDLADPAPDGMFLPTILMRGRDD
ncbi:hypothetical protein [Nostoc sp. UIC 10607]|uniref:hypothetical protein n=1 Tax=Nostoc sp. UIC 10607 TaxID=3045935 RepID=UPI0039A0515A